MLPEHPFPEVSLLEVAIGMIDLIFAIKRDGDPIESFGDDLFHPVLGQYFRTMQPDAQATTG